jgi:hypothetical protein
MPSIMTVEEDEPEPAAPPQGTGKPSGEDGEEDSGDRRPWWRPST